MSKKTLALIITLIVLTIVLLVVAFTTQNKQTGQPQEQAQQTATPTPTPVGHTLLTLEPNPVIPTTTGTTSATTVNVNINTNGDEVTAVQLEIAYDPKVLTNMRVTPGTFFTNPQILPVGGVNAQTGRITYMIAPTNIRETQTGTGTVATLSFTPVRTAGVTETEITLLDKSNVSARGAFGTSVLIQRQGTKVILTQTQTTTGTGSAQ